MITTTIDHYWTPSPWGTVAQKLTRFALVKSFWWGRVGLISIDYGKVLRWPGRGPISPEAKEAIVSARRAADSCGVPIRVHHVPARREVYASLLSE